MKFYKIKSYAKINISLGILGRFKSRLHKIESLISFLNLRDNIFIKKIKSKFHKVTFVGKFSKGIKKKNTIYNLLKILDNRKKLNNQKYLIKVNKKIPQKSGMGAGLKFAISYKKNVNFIGKEALMKIKDKELDKQLMMFTLKDSKPGEPLLLHDEPIYLDDKIIGRTTSGNYSFCYEKNLSFGYVNYGNSYETLNDKNVFIEVEKIKYPVNILKKPLNQKNYRS